MKLGVMTHRNYKKALILAKINCLRKTMDSLNKLIVSASIAGAVVTIATAYLGLRLWEGSDMRRNRQWRRSPSR